MSRSKSKSNLAGLFLGWVVIWTTSQWCVGQEWSADQVPTSDLTELSLEQLVNVEVTSVSKKEEKVFEAPSAVTIITSEDIRRSGATSVPEALRLAPGLDVARVDSHNWAVSARGFNDLFANKLLVLIDGRSVYTPLFSGVFWDVQDTILESVDRIEVIRGPGATLWGANAVNGVINIITKPSSQTQGLYVDAGGGSEEQGFGEVRYGGRLAEDLHYRAYVKYFNRDASVEPDGSAANDAWWMTRGGFRSDWEPDWANTLTVQGDLFYGDLDQTYMLPSLTGPPIRAVPDITHTGGGNVLARWTRAFSEDANFEFQAYYDRTERNSAVIDESRDTLDLDAHHRFNLGDRMEFVWGGGYRLGHDEQSSDEFVLRLDPESRDTHVYSGFVQSTTDLVLDRLKLTLGSKLEHNDYTGTEIQPSGRMTWLPSEKQSVWASVARAVRTPSRIEHDGTLAVSVIPAQPPSQPFPTAVVFQGTDSFVSEELLALELGYRVRPHARVSLDVATFYHIYDRLRSFSPGTPTFETTYVQAPFLVANELEGETYGVETALEYAPLEGWRWRASYTFLQMALHRTGGSADTFSESAEGSSPHHQVSLWSSVDLPYRIQLDVIGRFVDRLPTLDIPSYIEMDTRISWRPGRNWELSIVGQNLLDSQHPEFRSSFIEFQTTEIERAVYGKVTWKF